MTLQIIIRNKPRTSIKGRNISDFQENLLKEGWPSEFKNEEALDRAKFIENRENRILNRDDLKKIHKEMNS